MSASAANTTPKSKARLENDLEKNREEGNWRKCLDIAQQLSNTEHNNQQLIDFLFGEIKLELYLHNSRQHQNSSLTSITATDATTTTVAKPLTSSASVTLLNEAKKHLIACLNTSSKSPLCMDANLLMAKLNYIYGNHEEALKHIELSGIDNVTQTEKSLPLRVMKLVAESFAIKAMSLDNETSDKQAEVTNKTSSLSKKSSTKSIISSYLNKSTDLTIRYVQNMEKQQGPYFIVNIGPILEVALQRLSLQLLKDGQVKKAYSHYRYLLNACETQALINTRQILSRQLAEILIKGVSKSAWKEFDMNAIPAIGPWKPYRYTGQSLFTPKGREEEIFLLLLLSEFLASRNVILDRSPELIENRLQSLINVIAIYDLLVIFCTPLKFFYLEIFERAMKFSYGCKHIWMQFGLTLMETKRCPLRAVKIFDEVTRIDPNDALPCLLSAKICLLELNQAERALRYALTALNLIDENEHLKSKIFLTLGISYAIIYEESTETKRKLRSDYLNSAIDYFRKAIEIDEYDHLPYFHLALIYAHQRDIENAIKHAHLALMLCPSHMPTIQLLILSLSSMKEYQEALKLCEAALIEYPDQLLLLYIKANLEEIIFEDGIEMALLTAKEVLRCCKLISTEDQQHQQQQQQQQHQQTISNSNSYLTGTNYDTLSLRMEQTLSEVASVDSGVTHGEGTNTVSGISTDANASSKQLWNFQLQLWMLVTNLFIRLGQITEAEACIDGATGIFGNLSHQLMYLRGILCKAKGQLLEAKACLQNSISINYRNAKALQQLGHTYHMLGNQLAADKYLKDSLKIDATSHETWYFIGSVLDALGEHERAATCQATAIKLEATSPILPFNVIPRVVFE